MTHLSIRIVVLVAVLGAGDVFAQGTPVFSNLPDAMPGNVPSLGFQCCATNELGDEIALEPQTPRRAGFATVLMSSWALHSSYPALPASGYSHPITLNIYEDAAAALAHTPARSVTQLFTIPWRPEPDSSCPGTGWRSADDGVCYSGLAFLIVFDLRSMNYDLPSQFIYGLEFNTTNWGYHPIGTPGPWESLNVGFSVVGGAPVLPSAGTDLDPDVVYWNTEYGSWYTDGGAGGAGTLRADTLWSGLPIGIRFTAFAVPSTTASCKNGGWQNLVRADFSAFSNQGDCVSYANAQR